MKDRTGSTFAVELDGFALAITHWSDRADCRSRRPFESGSKRRSRSDWQLAKIEARSGS